MSRSVRLGVALLGLAILTAPARAADVEKLLPDDSEMVAAINVRQLLDSALVKKFGLETARELLKEQAEVQGILKDLGFDPFKDLDTLTVAGPGGSAASDKGLIIVQGRFDLAKFRAKAEERAKNMADQLKIEKEGAYTLYKIISPDATLFAALADQNTILVGQAKEYVVEALDKFGGKRAVTLKSKALQGLLAKVDKKQSIWLALPGSSLPTDLPIGDEKLKKSLAGIEAITGGINVTDEIRMKFEVAAKDTGAAKDLVRTINDGINQGKILLSVLGGQQLAPVADILGTIKAAARDKVVTLDCTIPADVIEKIRQAQ